MTSGFMAVVAGAFTSLACPSSVKPAGAPLTLTPSMMETTPAFGENTVVSSGSAMLAPEPVLANPPAATTVTRTSGTAVVVLVGVGVMVPATPGVAVGISVGTALGISVAVGAGGGGGRTGTDPPPPLD